MLLALATLVVAAGLGWWAFEKAHRRSHPVAPGLQAEIELPHEREWELYHNALSLCSMKTRVCLAELGIPYRSHPVDLIETGAYENLSRRYLALHPGGTVPLLVHRGHPVYESHEQIRYAAEHAPPGSPRLVPEAPAQREAMQRWVDRSSLTGTDPMREGERSAGNAIPGLTVPLFAAMIEEIGWTRILEGVLFHFDRRRPLAFLALKARGLAGLGRLAPAIQVLARSRRQMHAHLDAFEQQLAASGGAFVLGECFGLADVSWLVIFERLEQADLLHVFTGGGRRPACAAWWARTKARPAYAQAIAAQQHPTVVRGTRRLREAKAADPALRAALEGEAAEARAA
jgi:glutathione S-transferase